ncbi:flagellar export protein FliJ [Clostridium sp.]|uniref:flagellar export protein FliJ n=1 Tax=Clostridium sp. TaxID=1506 RepID=UPI002FCA10E4
MALGYKFKLQKLLEIREHEEENKKIQFMKANSEKQNIEKTLENLEDNYLKYSSMDVSLAPTFQRKIQQNYLSLLNSTIEATTTTLEELSKILENKRQDLVLAQVNRKTVEILKEKKKSQFLQEQDRIEQLQNDEFALYGFIRQTRR